MRGAFLILCMMPAACSDRQPAADDKVARETAELHMAVAAMENHPSLKQGQAGPATGQPITVPKSVRPRPAGVTLAPHRHGPPASKHKP